MKRTVRVFAGLAAVAVSSIVVFGCSDHSRRSINVIGANLPLISVKYKHKVTGQEVTSWQIRPGEPVVFVAQGLLSDGATSVTIDLTSTDIKLVSSTDTTRATVSQNGGEITVTANASNTGDTQVLVRAARNGSSEITGSLGVTVTNNPQNPGASNSALTDWDFRTTSGVVIGSHVQVQKGGSSFTIVPTGTTGTGSLTTFTSSEISILSQSNTSVGTVVNNGGQLVFTPTSTLGSTVLSVRAFKPGSPNIDHTLTVEVVDVVTIPPGGGGGGTGNPGTVLTDLTITAPGGNPNAGQSVQLTVGGTVSNPEAINWVIPDSDLVARNGVQSADGKYTPAKANTSVSPTGWGLGQVFNNPSDTNENWNQAKLGNSVTITSSGSTPSGIVIFAPAYMAVGERFQFFIKDLDTGQDLTLTVTPSILDQNGSSPGGQAIMTTTNNAAGQPIVFKALDDGLVTVSVVFGAKSFSMKVRVGVGNPLLTQFSGVRVIDQYMRVATPFKNPNNSNEWMLPLHFNLSKCSDTSSPAFLLFNGSLNGTTAPSLRTFTESGTNILWGEYILTYVGDSGTLNIDPNQYVGKVQSPVNSAEFGDINKYSFPVDLFRSRFYDTQNNGQDKNLAWSIERSSDPLAVRINMRDAT